MMKYSLLLIIFLITFFNIKAQTVILEREVMAPDSIFSNFGPNKKHFIHQFIALGVIMGSNAPGVAVKFPNSLDFKFGTRYKYKWSNTFASGIEIAYNSLDYHLLQEKDKIIPDTILHDKEKITLYNFEANIYQRINFGKRGDFIGNFFDIGAGYTFNLSRVHSFEDDLPTGERREVSIHKINFVNKTFPSAFIRVGWNRIVIYGQYRIGEVMKSPFPDLPKLHTGLQIGIH